MHPQQTSFEIIVGEEEIAHNKQCLLLNQKNISSFVNIFDIISLLAAELQDPKLACEVMG